MCKRTTTDPLLRMFLDRYGLHLLSIPREAVSVGDVWVHDGSRVSSAGSVTHLLDPALPVKADSSNEPMADISGTFSQDVSAEVGLGLLESFLTAMGAAGAVQKVKADFESKKAHQTRFRISKAVRDSVDAMKFGVALLKRRLVKGHPLLGDGRQCYVATAVTKSASITVSSQDDQKRKISLDAKVAHALDAEAGVQVQQSAQGEITFQGAKPLAFGVQLYELTLDSTGKKLKLKLPKDAVRTMAAGDEFENPAKPAWLGGADGDVFIDPPDAVSRAGKRRR